MVLVPPPGKLWYSALEYAALPEEDCPWVIKDLLPAGGSLLLHGQAKQGKSIAAHQMAYAIACGDEEWLGFKVELHGKVLYLQLDTGRKIWRNRTKAFNSLGYDAKDLCIIDKVSAPTPCDVLNPEHMLLLSGAVREIQPVVIFVDVLRKVSTLGENDSEEMIQVLNALEGLAKPSGAALVIITHTVKEGTGKFRISAQEMLMGGARGSTALVGNVDAIMMMSRRKLWYHSRSMDLGHVRVKFKKIAGDERMWEVDLDPVQTEMARVLRDETLAGQSEKARALALATGKSVEACRTMIRRAEEDKGPIGAHGADGDDDE